MKSYEITETTLNTPGLMMMMMMMMMMLKTKNTSLQRSLPFYNALKKTPGFPPQIFAIFAKPGEFALCLNDGSKLLNELLPDGLQQTGAAEKNRGDD